MPFTKYVVDPAHIEAMRTAFYRVCGVLQLERVGDPITELVALKIVDLAKAGELDPDRLCSGVLLELATRRPGMLRSARRHRRRDARSTRSQEKRVRKLKKESPSCETGALGADPSWGAKGGMATRTPRQRLSRISVPGRAAEFVANGRKAMAATPGSRYLRASTRPEVSTSVFVHSVDSAPS
jgi:hypothetical protein